MQFLRPFIKSKPQYGNLSVVNSEDLNNLDDDANLDNSDVNSDVNTSQMNSFHTEEIPNKRARDESPSANIIQSDVTEPSAKLVKKHDMTISKRLSVEADKSLIEYLNMKKAESSRNDPDLEFMKSLLPDIKKMSDYQKRLFKRRTLEVIDSILCDAPVQNSSTYVPSNTPSPAATTYSVVSYSTNQNSQQEFEDSTSTFHTLQPSTSVIRPEETTVQNYFQNYNNDE